MECELISALVLRQCEVGAAPLRNHPTTVNPEIGTPRAILRRNRLWAEVQPDIRMLATWDDIGGTKCFGASSGNFSGYSRGAGGLTPGFVDALRS